jgi:hypothetical protein
MDWRQDVRRAPRTGDQDVRRAAAPRPVARRPSLPPSTRPVAPCGDRLALDTRRLLFSGRKEQRNIRLWPAEIIRQRPSGYARRDKVRALRSSVSHFNHCRKPPVTASDDADPDAHGRGHRCTRAVPVHLPPPRPRNLCCRWGIRA